MTATRNRLQFVAPVLVCVAVVACGGTSTPAGGAGSGGVAGASAGAAGSMAGAGGSAGAAGAGGGAAGSVGMPACAPGGCSGQLCGEAGNEMASTCEYLEEYACYQDAVCERQAGGACGWTPTAELSDCIEAARATTRWYQSCGDPVCSADPAPSGAPACNGQQAGDACDAGAPECDPGEGCGVVLQCASSDPRLQPGGCPISRRRFKRDVTPLSAAKRLKLSQELLTLPMVTYSLKGTQAEPQLGFILEDSAPAFAVDAPRDRVNLYGFTSLAVVALQEQQRMLTEQQTRLDAQGKRIEQLERMLTELRGRAAESP